MTFNKESENNHEGHRDRLRTRFVSDPNSISEVEKLELLLTYAIPRVDVAPLALSLLKEYKTIENVISANQQSLIQYFQISKSLAIYFHLLEDIFMTKNDPNQELLFELPNIGSIPERQHSREKRVFADDETSNSIKFLPKIVDFSNIEDFKTFLQVNLPYNSEVTRKRRALYIVNRFFPTNSIDIPLTYFLAHQNSVLSIKSVVLYMIIKAEPLVQKCSEDLLLSNLPLGFIRRNQLKEFIEKSQPGLSDDSVSKAITALTNLYQNTDLSRMEGDRFYFSLRSANPETFLYIFTTEFPEPGMFSFDDLYNSPIYRWMLWDKEWIHNQLYNLRDLGIITKISEIDNINQFTIGMNQKDALIHFYKIQDGLHRTLRDKKTIG